MEHALSCAACGSHLEAGHRIDRRYCGGLCRIRAFRIRHGSEVVKRRASRSGTAGKPGSKTAERQAHAAAQKIEQLKKDLSNARHDAASARSEAEARSTELAAARAQVEQLQRDLSQAQRSASTARRETASRAAQWSHAGERIEQRQGEVEPAPYFQEEEYSASAALPQRWVKAPARSEQLSNWRPPREATAATETQELRSKLAQALTRERLNHENWQAARTKLDSANSEMTKMARVIREKDAMLTEAQERCQQFKADLERLTAERSGSPARQQEFHAAPKPRRSAQDLMFTSAPGVDEHLNEVARRINVESLRGQARRAAESIEQRRVALSAAAAHAEQQLHDQLANLSAKGYRAEEDPLVGMKIQEIQAEHEFAREQQLHGRYGQAQLLPPGTDLRRVALMWAMQARQLYIYDPPSRRRGHVYWQQKFICLDEESEQDLLRAVTEAFFSWRQKLYRYR